MVAKRLPPHDSGDVNITIKSLPDDLGAALRKAAQQSRRSLNGEIIHRSSASMVEDVRPTEFSPVVAESPGALADAWTALASRWKSDLSVEAEIAALYEARSPGRDVELTW